MVFSLTWMPEVLRSAGLKVAETDGWASRGRAEMGKVLGVMCHHTATRALGNMPTLALLKTGRPDLRGPLAQLGLGLDGTFYIIAAGRANHAGAGIWEGVRDGNSHFIGIEAENPGGAADGWPPVQLDAYRRGVAAMLVRVGAPARMCCGHKEYAPSRKIDPRFDMDEFRAEVGQIMRGEATVPPPIPEMDVSTGRLTLRRGARGPDVMEIQRAAHVLEDGIFGPSTEAAVRKLQIKAGLVGDGIVGPKTWKVIAAAPPPPFKGVVSSRIIPKPQARPVGPRHDGA